MKEELIDQIKNEISNLDIKISYDTEYTPEENANASFEYNGIEHNIDLKGQYFYDIYKKYDTSTMKVTEATITLTNESGIINHIKSRIDQIIKTNINNIGPQKLITNLETIYNEKNKQATITIKDFENGNNNYNNPDDDGSFKATVEVNGMSVDISEKLRPILINNGGHQMKIPISLDEQEQVKLIINHTINTIIPDKIKKEKELKENSIGGQNDEEIKN